MVDWMATVLSPVCPMCGAAVDELARLVPDLDWRDEDERRLGGNAYAVQRHLVEAHPVVPAVGDVVMYYTPWRGMRIGHGPLVVRAVTTSDLGRPKYWLADAARPNRESGWCWPSTGADDYPVSFEILAAFTAPPVEATLLDLLGDEWAEIAAET